MQTDGERSRPTGRKQLDRAVQILQQGGLRVARMAEDAEFDLLATSWRELRLIRVECSSRRSRPAARAKLADFPVPLFLNLLAKQAGIVREVWTFTADKHSWSIWRVGDGSRLTIKGTPRRERPDRRGGRPRPGGVDQTRTARTR